MEGKDMKDFCKKLSNVLKTIFGYGIMVCLFCGGLTFFAYVAAMFIGGDTAALICTFVYKTFMPIVIYATTCLVLFGLVAMYLNGEVALTPEKKHAQKHQGEV